MATTKIMTVHPAMVGAYQAIKDVTDYVMNPEKTNGGQLVIGYGCEADSVVDEFFLTRNDYRYKTKRDQGDSEILLYHVRQSFLPGEVDVDTAQKLGEKLAMELTGGNFSFIVCTHTDKPHLHNHIIISAVNMDCDRKFRNGFNSFKRVREISDRICKEHFLSVVENPGHATGMTNRYRPTSKRDGLAGLIDEVIDTGKAKDFDDFLKLLVKKGCKIKRRGKLISIKPPGADRFFRLKAGVKCLPYGYDEDSLRMRIAEMQTVQQATFQDVATDRSATTHTDAEGQENLLPLQAHVDTPVVIEISADTDTEPMPVTDASTMKPDEPNMKICHDKKINLLIDIENSIKAKDSPGYERWAKGFNLQQAAETLLFLQTHNLTDINDLTQIANQAKSDYNELQKRIDAADIRIKEVNTMQRHIGAYNKNKNIYSQYQRMKRNPKFREENEKAIATVEEAKAFFDSLGLEQLPTIAALREEYSFLTQEKNNCYQARNQMRQHVFDLQSALKNVETIIGHNAEQRDQRTKKKGQEAQR